MPTPSTPFMHAANRRYIRGSSNEAILTYVSYGAFAFPAAVNVSFNISPVYDSSGRVPKWYTHTFTVETVIDPTTSPMNDAGGQYPVDLNMSQVRRWLSIPGQRLAFWNLGIGQNERLNTTTSVSNPTGTGSVAEPANSNSNLIKQDPIANIPSSSHYSFVVDAATDLNFGPKPQLLACECIGGSRAFRVVWTVECALPICCLTYTQGDGFTLCYAPEHFNGAYQEIFNSVLSDQIKVLEFNYSLSWEVDEARFTRFTIVGSVEFSGILFYGGQDYDKATLTGAVIDTGRVIDALAKCFYLRPGFNRSIQWDLSRDKRRLDFRITDKEIPSDQPFYPGILDCRVNHSIQGSPLSREWTMNFSAEYELQPGVAKYWALIAFVALIQDRTRYIGLGETEFKDNKTKTKIGKPWMLPLNFSFNENIYTRKVSFDFSFSLICDFKMLFLYTRLFSNVQAPSSWLEHYSKLPAQVLDLKGGAQIRTLQHEPLVTACRFPDLFIDVTAPYVKGQASPQQFSLFQATCPPADRSILYFQFTPKTWISNNTIDMLPMSWATPRTFTQDSGQQENASSPSNLSIDPDKKTFEASDATLPSTRARIAEFNASSFGRAEQYQTILSQLVLEGNAKFSSQSPLIQGGPPSIQYLKIVGGMASVCHHQQAPAVKKLRVLTQDNAEPIWVNPVIAMDSFDGPTQINPGSPIPIYIYKFYYVFKIVGGYTANGIMIHLNGEDLTWDLNSRVMKVLGKELNGFKFGDFQSWLDNPPPPILHSP